HDALPILRPKYSRSNHCTTTVPNRKHPTPDQPETADSYRSNPSEIPQQHPLRPSSSPLHRSSPPTHSAQSYPAYSAHTAVSAPANYPYPGKATCRSHPIYHRWTSNHRITNETNCYHSHYARAQ